jgi:hypothetical protein
MILLLLRSAQAFALSVELYVLALRLMTFFSELIDGCKMGLHAAQFL